MSAVLESRQEPGRTASAVLAVLVHVVLLLLLVYGIRWQTRPPEAVEVQLVRTAPAPPAPAAEPLPPRPAPPPVPEVAPKPATPAKPDIALREKERPRPKPEPEAKPTPRTEAKPQPDKASHRLLEEDLKALAAERERRLAAEELARVRAAQASVAREKAVADYISRIRAKIKGNIVLPPDLRGNPEAVFDVVQLPSGEILSVKLKKSSGHAAYDAAVERAILKSSPLPRPEQAELFSRHLELKFRPLEE